MYFNDNNTVTLSDKVTRQKKQWYLVHSIGTTQ